MQRAIYHRLTWQHCDDAEPLPLGPRVRAGDDDLEAVDALAEPAHAHLLLTVLHLAAGRRHRRRVDQAPLVL